MKPHQLTRRSLLRSVNESTIDTFLTHWDGHRWRWWALATGVLSVPIAALIALLISWITGERYVPLAMLVLITVILVGSLVGSGFIDSLTSRMTRGGLARESTDFVEATQSDGDRERNAQREKGARDRRTIRAGLFILGPMVAFVYLLAIV